MTTLQKTLIGAVLVAAVGTGIYEARQASRLRREVQNLQQQPAGMTEQIQRLTSERDNAASQLAALQGENERLNRSTAELLRLRGEVGVLRQQTNDLGKRIDAAPSLRQARPEELQAPSQITELARAKQVFVSAWLQAFFAYAQANQGQCPETFQQAARFLPDSIKELSMTADQFEILYQGPLDAIKDQDIIVLREKDVWQQVGGKWGRFYGVADGSAQYCSSSDKTATGSFDNYEKPRLVQSSNQ